MAFDSDLARMRQLGRDAAKSQTTQTTGGIQRCFGTVSAVNSDGTLDVEVRGSVLGGLRMTTACDGAAEGDRCIIDTVGHLSLVTGVLV